MNKIQKEKSESKNFRFFSSKTKIRVVQIALLTLLLSAAAMGGTYAYLMANTTPVANDFTFAMPAVTINEPSVDPAHVAWGATSKPVSLSIPANTIGGAVRASIIPMLKDAAGNMIAVPTGPMTAPSAANTIIMGDITLHFASDWSTNWFFRDGFFYYREALGTGQTTALLLEGVTLTTNTPEMITKYQAIVVDIEVMADVLQADQSALSNWGITIDSDGNIS